MHFYTFERKQIYDIAALDSCRLSDSRHHKAFIIFGGFCFARLSVWLRKWVVFGLSWGIMLDSPHKDVPLPLRASVNPVSIDCSTRFRHNYIEIACFSLAYLFQFNLWCFMLLFPRISLHSASEDGGSIVDYNQILESMKMSDGLFAFFPFQ